MHATKEQISELGRLKKRSDFLRVQGSGHKWVSKSLILQISPNHSDVSRFGVTATKRLSKSAVVRNRVKRRLRALSCDVLPTYAIPGYDYVLVGRAETIDRDYAVLQKDLRWCIRRLNLDQKHADVDIGAK
jgi:ribonuclease P protein component